MEIGRCQMTRVRNTGIIITVRVIDDDQHFPKLMTSDTAPRMLLYQNNKVSVRIILYELCYMYPLNNEQSPMFKVQIKNGNNDSTIGYPIMVCINTVRKEQYHLKKLRCYPVRCGSIDA